MPRSFVPRTDDAGGLKRRSLLRKRGSQRAAERAERLWYAGVVISVLCHLSAVTFAAGVVAVMARGKSPRDALDTRWSAAFDNGIETFERIDLPEMESLTDARVEFTVGPALESTQPAEFYAALPPAEIPSDSALAEYGGAELLASIGTQIGVGGAGAGIAGGAPGRFFGIQGEGNRFVYVVDRSGSMSSAYNGPGNTRMGRVKLEIAAALQTLTPEQQFFIIFFDHQVLPMPAPGLQPAVPEVQDYYVRWLSKIGPNGETDPRAALAIALSLNPDAIFLLTDGEFPAAVKRDMLSIRQDRVAIHTIAFGNRRGHDVLRRIAENNGGKFAFVP